ncbi:MAG TPA: hypothetical protein VGI33_12615 [Paenibacillus sp.]|jgi:hypothetical protein
MVLSEADIQKIYGSLLEANITDLSIRAEHIEKASNDNKTKQHRRYLYLKNVNNGH